MLNPTVRLQIKSILILSYLIPESKNGQTSQQASRQCVLQKTRCKLHIDTLLRYVNGDMTFVTDGRLWNKIAQFFNMWVILDLAT